MPDTREALLEKLLEIVRFAAEMPEFLDNICGLHADNDLEEEGEKVQRKAAALRAILASND